jgi:hypothetical protein
MNIDRYLNTVQLFFTEKVNHLLSVVLFKRTLYAYIILNGLISLPIMSQVWSNHAYLLHYYPQDNFLMKILNSMSNPGLSDYYWFFVIGQIICAVLALFGVQKRLMGVLLCFLSMNLYYNSAQIQNGGTNLLILVLFYLMFVNEDAEKSKYQGIKTVDISITNFAFLAIQIQVCVLYLVSAISKLYGSHWLDGSALYYVFNLDAYSGDWIKRHIANNDWVSIPLTYFTICFQFAFPFTVWIKKLKPITLSIGVLFHILIIFIMGITDFGIIMLVMYIPFIRND